MIRKPYIFLVLVLVVVLGLFHTAQAQTVVNFNLWNFTSQNVTNRKTLLTPVKDTLIPPPGHLAILDPLPNTTDASGNFSESNMVQGYYYFDVYAPPAATRWLLYVPTNAV